MKRPALTPRTSAADFRAFYWLKEELAAFCRAQGLPPGESKEALSRRIEAYLNTGEIQPAGPRRRQAHPPAEKMPEQFTRATVIGEGWRCSQTLRAFFEQEIGPAFHFNGVMREIIQHGAGQTLQMAIDTWQADQQKPKEEKAIGAQFEYNRHVREYFKAHAGATLKEAIAAWREKKRQRKG